MKRARLQTNLVGRHVHLITDEEVRQEARKQEKPLDSETLANLTAEQWYPAMKAYRRRFGDQTGEIVAVRVADGDYLVYTLSFGGQLIELISDLWRLDPI